MVDHVDQLLEKEKNTHSPQMVDVSLSHHQVSDLVEQWVNAINDSEDDPDDDSTVKYFQIDALSGRGTM
jgi:hypothetical protein